MTEYFSECPGRVKETEIMPPTRKRKAERVAIARALPTFWVSGKKGVWKDGGKSIPSLRMMDK